MLLGIQVFHNRAPCCCISVYRRTEGCVCSFKGLGRQCDGGTRRDVLRNVGRRFSYIRTQYCRASGDTLQRLEIKTVSGGAKPATLSRIP